MFRSSKDASTPMTRRRVSLLNLLIPILLFGYIIFIFVETGLASAYNTNRQLALAMFGQMRASLEKVVDEAHALAESTASRVTADSQQTLQAALSGLSVEVAELRERLDQPSFSSLVLTQLRSPILPVNAALLDHVDSYLMDARRFADSPLSVVGADREAILKFGEEVLPAELDRDYKAYRAELPAQTQMNWNFVAHLYAAAVVVIAIAFLLAAWLSQSWIRLWPTERRLQRQVAALQDQNALLQSLYRIAHVINGQVDANAALRTVLEEGKKLTGVTNIVIMQPQGDYLTVTHSTVDLPPEARPPMPRGVGATGQVWATRQPLAIEDYTKSVYHAPGNPVKALVALPLLQGETMLGMMLFRVMDKPRHFSATEQRLLSSLAELVVLCLRNEQHHLETQRASAAAERERLAHELHDEVTQTLSAAQLTASSLPFIMKRDPQRAEQLAGEVVEFTTRAATEMRALLAEMYPHGLLDQTLGSLIRQLVEMRRAQFEGKVKSQIDAVPELPPDAQRTFYRVTQEALTNARKYAEAATIQIELRHTGHEIRLMVQDDGVGFDPAATQPARFGLVTMAHRAQSIGATLEVHSKPGDGTRVTLTWSPPSPSHAAPPSVPEQSA